MKAKMYPTGSDCCGYGIWESPMCLVSLYDLASRDVVFSLNVQKKSPRGTQFDLVVHPSGVMGWIRSTVLEERSVQLWDEQVSG